MAYAYSDYDGICQFISQVNQKKKKSTGTEI